MSETSELLKEYSNLKNILDKADVLDTLILSDTQIEMDIIYHRLEEKNNL